MTTMIINTTNGKVFAGRGAYVYASTSQSLNSGDEIAFDSSVYDTDSLHAPLVNNKRLTVPAGVSKIKLLGAITIQADLGEFASFAKVVVVKNGTDVVLEIPTLRDGATGNVNPVVNFITPMLLVSQNDYFTVLLVHNGSNTNILVGSTPVETWFSMELVA